MTAKELAAQIDCRRRKCELTKEEKALLRKNNLLVILAAGDDGVFLDGAIEDEYDQQSRFSFQASRNPNNGLWEIEKKRGGNLQFSFKCNTKLNNAFEISTPLEHCKFTVLDEDGDGLYCIGLVIDLTQLLTLKNQENG